MSLKFAADVMLKAAESADGEWLVHGPVASLKEDYDGETLEKAGILNGLKCYWRMGRHVDYDHQYHESIRKGKPDPDLIIGQAIGVEEINGVPTMVTRLFKSNPLAQKLWRQLQDGMELGYSILGIAKRRDPKNPKIVKDTDIHMVTIAPSPKGYDARIHPGGLMAVAKAIAAMPPIPEEEEEEAPGMEGLPPGLPPGGLPPMGMEGAPPPDMEGGAGAEEAPPQMSKAEANYGPGQGFAICGNCAHFLGDKCELVKGLIKEQDTCDTFAPMPQEEAQGAPGPEAPMGMPPPGGMPGGMPPMAKAVDAAHAQCPKCKGKMYCLSCHRAGKVEKAYTTGNDIVMPGESGAAALRTQQMGTDKPKKKKRKSAPAEKSLTLTKALANYGASDPEALAKRVREKLSRL